MEDSETPLKKMNRNPGLTAPSRRTQRRNKVYKSLDEILQEHRGGEGIHPTEGDNTRLPDNLQLMTAGITITQRERSPSPEPAAIMEKERTISPLPTPGSYPEEEQKNKVVIEIMENEDGINLSQEIHSNGATTKSEAKFSKDDIQNEEKKTFSLGSFMKDHLRLPKVTLTVSSPESDESKVLCVSSEQVVEPVESKVICVESEQEGNHSGALVPMDEAMKSKEICVIKNSSDETTRTVAVHDPKSEIGQLISTEQRKDFLAGTKISAMPSRFRSEREKEAMHMQKMLDKIKNSPRQSPQVDNSVTHDIAADYQLVTSGLAFREEYEALPSTILYIRN